MPVQHNLVGMTFFTQWVAIELGTGGQIVAATSTDALRLVIGSF